MNERYSPIVQIHAVRDGEGQWIKIPIPELSTEIDILPLHDDAETGMWIVKMMYRAGHTTTWHTHPCGHGMYVLEGTLVTHQGDFGPGSFVWFPEGGMMQHGTTLTDDATFLFMTNKPFDISFCEGPQA